MGQDQYRKALTAKATIEDVVNLIHQSMDHHRKTYHSRIGWWRRLRDRLRGPSKAKE